MNQQPVSCLGRSPVVRQGLLRPGREDHHQGLWMRPHGHVHGPGHLGRPPQVTPGHGVRLGAGTHGYKAPHQGTYYGYFPRRLPGAG